MVEKQADLHAAGGGIEKIKPMARNAERIPGERSFLTLNPVDF